MLDALTQRLSSVIKTMRGHARLTEENVSEALREVRMALLEMEALLFRILFAAFVLLTLTVVSGLFFSEQVFGKPLQATHKTVFGIISWLIFGSLLWGRYFRGWRGKRAVYLTLWGFAALLLAYLGSKFVLEIILHRG